MPGCALGHFNGCSARATGLQFEQVDVGRRRKADGEVAVTEHHAGPAAFDGSDRSGDAAMDLGRELLRLREAELVDLRIVNHKAAPPGRDEADAVRGMTGNAVLCPPRALSTVAFAALDMSPTEIATGLDMTFSLWGRKRSPPLRK